MRAKTATRPIVSDFVFTGQRRDGHFRVDVAGKPVWLPCASFKTLAKLAVALIRTDSGLAAIDRLTIHRLRKSLGKHGKELIAIGSGEEYRLTIPKTKIAEYLSPRRVFPSWPSDTS